MSVASIITEILALLIFPVIVAGTLYNILGDFHTIEESVANVLAKIGGVITFCLIIYFNHFYESSGSGGSYYNGSEQYEHLRGR